MKKFRRFRLKSKKRPVDVPLIDFEALIAEIRKTREGELDSPKTFFDPTRTPRLLGMLNNDHGLGDLEPGWTRRIFGDSAQIEGETTPEESGQ